MLTGKRSDETTRSKRILFVLEEVFVGAAATGLRHSNLLCAPRQPHTQIFPDALDPSVKQSVCDLGSGAGSRLLEKLSGSQDLARVWSRAMTEVLLELNHHRPKTSTSPLECSSRMR